MKKVICMNENLPKERKRIVYNNLYCTYVPLAIPIGFHQRKKPTDFENGDYMKVHIKVHINVHIHVHVITIGICVVCC